ncbi:MAG: GSCFA domain-containing protein [Sphingobacteriaceae bacterium]|nr:GSCFA domain-containing protein [Sphingobacteriaceae bacterium]
MKLHLNHTPIKAPYQLDHQSGIFLIGSCFAVEIGNILNEHRFPVLQNPNGILFNPRSIENSLSEILSPAFEEKYLLKRGDEFYSFAHHSSVKASSKEELMQKIKNTQTTALQFLKTAKVLIITFGSAFYYKHKELNGVVANCHKQSGALFTKELCSVENIVKQYTGLLTEIKKINPLIQFIFTVSPVKYLKDGLENNALSKSTLLLAAQNICKLNKDCHYFPAYELVSDDLRDYRFFKEDLAHPNQMAVNYVWEKFAETFFSEKSIKLNHKIEQLNKAKAHRPLHNNPEEEEKLKEFVNDLDQEIMKELGG